MSLPDDHLLELLEELILNIQKQDLELEQFSIYHLENEQIMFQFTFSGDPKMYTKDYGSLPLPTTIQ